MMLWILLQVLPIFELRHMGSLAKVDLTLKVIQICLRFVPTCAIAKAGNIIPAVATSNAVIAGLVVLEAAKVLAGQVDKCRTV